MTATAPGFSLSLMAGIQDGVSVETTLPCLPPGLLAKPEKRKVWSCHKYSPQTGQESLSGSAAALKNEWPG